LNNQSISWKKNLYVIAIAEYFAIVGFSLFAPFLPLYIQQLGNYTTEQASVWVGVAIGGAGIAMFISSPIWGIISDRLGRKPMLLRAQIGGAVIIALLIIAPNVYTFVGLRIIQGLFTGTVTAASAMVAAGTPRDKLPLAMGTLLGAVFAGSTTGPLLGGFLADTVGIQATFGITAGLLALGGIIILFFSSENFQRPVQGQSTSLKDLLKLAASPKILPLLMVIAALNLGPQIVQPMLPLIISEVSPADKAASLSGLALGLMGIMAAISSFVIGRFNRRFPVRNILIVCCICTGLLYLPPIWAGTAVHLIILIGITGLMVGGIVTSSNSLVGMAVPVAQQGVGYGLSQSAMSLGGGIGPFIGGGLVQLIGLRPVFAVTAGVYILVGIVAALLIPRQISRSN
jgi:MFS transporter, DHA1 family, multidrug resistance protein